MYTAKASQPAEEARVEALSARYFAQQRRDEARAAEAEAGLLIRYAKKLADKFGLDDLDLSLRFWGR